MNKKPTARSKQAAATKRRISRVGLKLIRTHGFDQVNVEDIARAAGVSVGTFYYYFPSKNDLLGGRRIDEYFEKEVADKLSSGSCVERVATFFHYYAQFSLNDGIEIVRGLYCKYDSKLIISQKRYIQQLMIGILADAQSAGELLAGTVIDDMLLPLFMCAQGVIFQWYITGGKIDLERELYNTVLRVLNTFLAAPVNIDELIAKLLTVK